MVPEIGIPRQFAAFSPGPLYQDEFHSNHMLIQQHTGKDPDLCRSDVPIQWTTTGALPLSLQGNVSPGRAAPNRGSLPLRPPGKPVTGRLTTCKFLQAAAIVMA
jgi:hypothetical protein